MFNLLLTILISAVSLLSQASPTLGTFGLGGLGIGGGALGTQEGRYFGYGSGIQDPQLFRYYYGLTGVPQNLYSSIRPTPFNYPYYRNTAPGFYNSPQVKYSNFPTLKSVRSPQNLRYLPYSRTIPTGFPSFPLNRHYDEPYYESVETYTSYNASEVENVPSNMSLTFLNKVKNENSTLNVSSEIGGERSAQTPIKDENSKTGQGLQMTYLGYAPMSTFRTTPYSSAYRQSGPLAVSLDDVPFYPLNVDSSVSSYQRSSSSSSPILLSPYRLRTTLPQQGVYSSIRPQFNNLYNNNYIPNNFGTARPIVSPYPSTPSNGVWPQNSPYFSSGSPYIVSRYRSNPEMETTQVIDTSASTNVPHENSEHMTARSQNGYYLIDVQPVGISRSEQLGYARAYEPVLGLIPLVPLIQPRTKLVTTQSHIKTDEGKKIDKYENQAFNTGFDTKTATGHIYSQLHTDKGSSFVDYHKKGGYTFSGGTGLNTFGSSEGLTI